MRILGFCDRYSGCGYHRVSNPLAFIPDCKYAHVTDMPKPEVLAQGWDIILFNRLAQVDSDLDLLRKETGCKVVVDIDDEWVLPFGHVNYDLYVELRPRIENNLRQADLVTVTHERLRQRCLEFNSNVEVIPNAVQFGYDQYTEDKVPSDVLRLFWAGGVSHVDDMEILRNPMKRISSLKVNTVIGGYNASNEMSKELWGRMVSSFTNGLKIPGMVLNSLPVTEYMNHFVHGDVMLLPLTDSYWHTMKSNLKLIECASKRIPVIVSKVQPYLDYDPPVFYIEKQKDWFEYVNFFVKNPHGVKFWGDKLHEWGQQFSIWEVNKKRTELFQSLIN